MNAKTTYPFVKMHGLGNDFIIFDARDRSIELSDDQVRALSNRKRGIGCDQLAILRNSDKADVYMDMRNADGSTIGACGNMTRCVAQILFDETGKSDISIETKNGVLSATQVGNMVRVNMGLAKLDWRDIPLAREMDTLSADISVGPYSGPVCVSMGNPHMVFVTDNAEDVDVERWGPIAENHEMLPRGANVSFISMQGDAIRMRVWERGTGVTEACGSGACAVLVSTARRGLTGREADVHLDGGTLHIHWLDDGSVDMTGPTAFVYSGTVQL